MKRTLYATLALVVAFSCGKPEEVIPGRVARAGSARRETGRR